MLQLWSAGLIKGLLDKVLHVRLADSGEGHSQELIRPAALSTDFPSTFQTFPRHVDIRRR
jgi:hypothetical protein